MPPKEKTAHFHYCLEENHPGAPGLQDQPLSVARIFRWDEDSVPECPGCGRQVNSIPCGEDMPPPSIIELAGRIR